MHRNRQGDNYVFKRHIQKKGKKKGRVDIISYSECRKEAKLAML